MEQICHQLFALQDTAYRDFHSRLIPQIPKETIIGVRMPMLRDLAKALVHTRTAQDFLAELPHTYYEENNLHALLIGYERDYGQCIAEINRFLPFVNNWATCDSLRPKAFAKHKTELEQQITQWLADAHPYTVRFGLEMLMVHFADGAFSPHHLQMAASVQHHSHYYIRMMLAWYFATLLAKQPACTMPFLTEHRLPVWVHNKTIQKALESYRIPTEMKALLRSLRR